MSKDHLFLQIKRLYTKQIISIWYNSIRGSSIQMCNFRFLTASIHFNHSQFPVRGCGFTRRTFSPRMKSWLRCRVWILPYFCVSFFSEVSFAIRLVFFPPSDSSDSARPCSPSPADTQALLAFSWSASSELSWTFSFSKSCSEYKRLINIADTNIANKLLTVSRTVCSVASSHVYRYRRQFFSYWFQKMYFVPKL